MRNIVLGVALVLHFAMCGFAGAQSENATQERVTFDVRSADIRGGTDL